LHDEYFDGKSEMDYKRLESILLEWVNQEGKEADFVRLLIVYLLTMFLFPLRSGKVVLRFMSYLFGSPGEFSQICLGPHGARGSLVVRSGRVEEAECSKQRKIFLISHSRLLSCYYCQFITRCNVT
jgi:hypothetical protein